MDGKRPDTTTGKPPEPTPLLASAVESTAVESKPAQPRAESGSTRAASILALLQTDFSDLQSLGLKLAILARDDRLYIMVEYPDHVLGFESGEFLLDGAKASEA